MSAVKLVNLFKEVWKEGRGIFKLFIKKNNKNNQTLRKKLFLKKFSIFDDDWNNGTFSFPVNFVDLVRFLDKVKKGCFRIEFGFFVPQI